MSRSKKTTRIFNRTQKFSFEMPPMRLIEKIMVAGQENPFVSQFYSVLVSRNIEDNKLNAPINFIYCIDLFKITKVFEYKEMEFEPNIKNLLVVGAIDTIIAAHSLVLEADHLELGTNFLSVSLEDAKKIVKDWKLPSLVIPLVIIPTGFPETPPLEHHRFPSQYIYFEDEYIRDDEFDFMDLFFELNHDSSLINFYENLTSKNLGETKDFENWLEMMKFNCEDWSAKTEELLKVIEYCGISLKA